MVVAQHRFVCEKCGFEVFDTDSKTSHVCPTCNTVMFWDLGNVTVSGGTYNKPVISESLAINPNQTEEHKKLFPNVGVLSDGRLRFDDYKTHDNYLEVTGFVKHPQRLHNTRRIYT